MAKHLLGIGVGNDPIFDASAKTIDCGANFIGEDNPLDFVINNTTNKLIYRKLFYKIQFFRKI